MSRVAVLVLLLMFSAALPAATETDAEVQTRIFNDYLKRAQDGDRDARFVVGHRYEVGVGTNKNLEQAYYWYGQAAEQGHPLAKMKMDLYREQRDAEARAKVESNRAKEVANAMAEAAKSKHVAEPRKPAKLAHEETPKRPAKPAVAEAAAPVKVATAAPAAPEPAAPAINAADVVMTGQWLRDQAPAEYLPSSTTNCLRTGTAEVVCFSDARLRDTGEATVTYMVKSTLSHFGKDGSFQINYVYNVTDLEKKSSGRAQPSDIELRTGWQEPGRMATCRTNSEKSISCTTDRKLALQFSRP